MSKVEEYLRLLDQMNSPHEHLSDLDEEVRMSELDKLWYSMTDVEQAEVERRIAK